MIVYNTTPTVIMVVLDGAHADIEQALSIGPNEGIDLKAYGLMTKMEWEISHECEQYRKSSWKKEE